jgi:hypothetical protein
VRTSKIATRPTSRTHTGMAQATRSNWMPPGPALSLGFPLRPPCLCSRLRPRSLAWLHTRIPKALAVWNYSGLFAVGSSEILLVDHELVQSGSNTSNCGSIRVTSFVEDGENANDCGIVKWRETVGLQTPRESRECMGSRHSPLSNPCKVPGVPTSR